MTLQHQQMPFRRVIHDMEQLRITIMDAIISNLNWIEQKRFRLHLGQKRSAVQRMNGMSSLIDSNNRSVQIYQAGTTETYTCYLKKGTYNIKFESHYSAAYARSAVNVPYAVSYKESEINLAKPSITSISAAQEGTYSYEDSFLIKIKNPGDARLSNKSVK